MKTISFETTTSTGLPVYVEATVFPPEPDVGIFSEYVDEVDAFFVPRPRAKKRYRIPQALLDREYDHLREAATEARFDD